METKLPAFARAMKSVWPRARKLSADRLLVLLFVGVVMTLAADLGVRVSVNPAEALVDHPWLRLDVREIRVPKGEGGYTNAMRYMYIPMDVLAQYHFDPVNEQKLFAAWPSSVPYWVARDGGPLHAVGRDWKSGSVAFGMPLRSSVSDAYLNVPTRTGKPTLKIWGGQVWYIHGKAASPQVHRVVVWAACLNVLCYAGVTWVVLTGMAAAARARRRWRGGCVVCGYAVGTLAVCPECGTAARGVAAGSATSGASVVTGGRANRRGGRSK